MNDDQDSTTDPNARRPIVRSKLEPPPRRPGMVVRDRLLTRLMQSVAPMVTIFGPAGYGKTTTAAQWAQRGRRPCAWLTLDPHDNDPAVLLTYLSLTLEPLVGLVAPLVEWLGAPGQSMAAATHSLLGSLENADAPAVLVIDDVKRITNTDSMDLLADVLTHLPDGWQVALVAREIPAGLPIARYRAEDRLEEVTATDLAMDDEEATALVRGAGLELDAGQVARLNREVEGWPVALHLVTLAVGAGAPLPDDDGAPIARDQFLFDYVQSEILARLPDDDVAFLTRTSFLERLSGGLCDAVLQKTGSSEQLHSLASRQALVIPLDRRRRWYRYHLLLREILRAELRRLEPHLVDGLVARAADWYESNGLPELAAELAMEAHDQQRVANVLAASGQAHYRRGRRTTVERWVSWLDKHDAAAASCDGAIVGSWTHVIAGRAAAAERWIAQAEIAADREGLPPEDPARGDIHALHAAMCCHGVDRMRRDAQQALTKTSPTSAWRAAAILTAGVAELLAGRTESAGVLLTEAVEVSTDVGAVFTLSIALAELTAHALARDQVPAAATLADRTSEHLREHGLDDSPSSALGYATVARTRLLQGDAEAAKAALGRAHRLRPYLSHAMPWFAVQARLEMTRCAMMQADLVGARTLLREVDDVFARRPDLGMLGEQARELSRREGELQADAVGASALTGAELRLLPQLATHLSFSEIGARFFVSRNTVKTQAMSIYRKLGVSSRSEAVEHARERGLLGPW